MFQDKRDCVPLRFAVYIDLCLKQYALHLEDMAIPFLLQVLCKSFDPGVGGRDFDQHLLVHFAEEFKNKYKIDTMARPKQRLRLTQECEKLKKVLSTVTVRQTLSIECFADDKDVTGTTNRYVLIIESSTFRIVLGGGWSLK